MTVTDRASVNPKELRRALGSFPTAVTVMTTLRPDGSLTGVTVNSFASVSLDPPLLLWSLVSHSPSLAAFRTASHFCVNVLAAAQEDLCFRFAARIPDKFAGVAWAPGQHGVPVSREVRRELRMQHRLQQLGRRLRHPGRAGGAVRGARRRAADVPPRAPRACARPRLMPVYGPRDSIHPGGAAIGPGLPFGIGAALAAGPGGRKTVMMAGDGGFAMNMAELWTAAQERAELCAIIMNDGVYAAIGHIQNAYQDGRRYFTELCQPDLLSLAALAGIPAWCVDRADALGEMVSRALPTPGPTLVEVDMRAIGPVPAYGPYAKARSG